MSPSPVASVVGELIKLASTELLEVVKIIASSKTECKELKERLQSIKAIIDNISRNISDTSPDTDNQFGKFAAFLQEGIIKMNKLEEVHDFDIFRKYRYGIKIVEFQSKLNHCFLPQVPLQLYQLVQKMEEDSRAYLQRIESKVDSAIALMSNNTTHNSIMHAQINTTQACDMMHETTAAYEAITWTSQVPDLPKFVVGLDNRIKDVKQILLQSDVNIVGITGTDGSGKTTLAAALCRDTDVKNFFENNIFFITVSLIDNVKGPKEILEVMWDTLRIPGQRPQFSSTEDARNQLNEQLKSIYRPTLLVLDDVWFTSSLESLLFEAKGYKTIITTRHDSTIPPRDSTRHLYKVEKLEEANALSLFCFCAFGQTSIPTMAKKNLVKQVVAECNGSPLALKVIGSSLGQAPRAVWEATDKKISRLEHIPDSRRELLHRLETSVDVLDEESKQCFLDLGAFPEGRKFSVDSLLDIWVYVRGMEWKDAFVVLLELAKRNLINLIGNPGSGAMEYKCASELFFSQHEIMRDLAVHLANDGSIDNRKRLFMPRKEDNIPNEWQTTLTNQVSGAQFLSIHTGAMREQDWCQIRFPEVEALALIFEAKQYCVPAFLRTMPKLKVLILYNYSSQRAILSGLPSFPSPVQIRSVLLNKLRVPPLYDNWRSWERLEKLYICLCEGLENITRIDKEVEAPFQSASGLPVRESASQDRDLVHQGCICTIWNLIFSQYNIMMLFGSEKKEVEAPNFPNIKEINIDHCSDLGELPAQLCNLTSLEILSVTNCHLIQELPEDLGRLRSMRVLRLSACPKLSRLPPSICNLGELEYLDISQCGYLKDLPSEFDQLSKLEWLDMRECSGLKKLHKIKLESLKRVIIPDQAMEGEWLSIPDLTVEFVEERFSLDWLDE